MNIETKLYPFRLEEAKQNNGNVVTRDGKPWRFLKLQDHHCADCVLCGEIEGASSYWCADGKFSIGIEDGYDLFMTTPPEDKSEPTPAEEVAEHSDIIRVNKFISIMEAVILFPEVDNAVKFNAVCSGTTRRERDDAIARLAASEQEVSRLTRERDEVKDGAKMLGMALDINLDLQNKADMWRDEFVRIKACPGVTEEIVGLCDRAMSDIRSNISLIDQREKVADENDDLRTRLATAEKEVSRMTRERDEARDGYNHLVEENNEKQEVIEATKAQLATLRGELEEAKTQLLSARENLRVMEGAEGSLKAQVSFHLTTIEHLREELASERLRTSKPAHTWTPTSERLPKPSKPGVKAEPFICKTIVESDRLAILTYIFSDDQWTLGEGDTQKVTHWMPLPPLPTPPESESRKDAEFDKWYSLQQAWVRVNNDRAALKLGYEAGQASREGGGK